MTSVLEQFVLGALALNDNVKFTMEEVEFSAAAKKPQFVGNANSDGEVLVQESNYTNAYLAATIRVVPALTSDAGREALGELTDALQNCEREEGGSAFLWTPNESVRTYTGYAILAEHTEIPITPTGETAGWFLKSPVVKVKLTLKPFFTRPERVVLAAKESGAEPLQVVYVGGILGDVPAEARLRLIDTASTDRRYAAFGRDVVASESNPPLLITAANMVISGFSGAVKTRTGAYSEEKVIRATAVSSATTACSTGRIKDIGSYAVYLRVFTASPNARFRISYKNGDGPLIPLRWQEAQVVEGFAEIPMGEVFLDEVELGEQTSEIRVEIKSVGAAIEVDAPNYLMLWPTSKGSNRARGIANNEPTKLLAYDEFTQSAGSLDAPKALPLGGNWAEAEKVGANGFQVNATTQVAERAKVSDATLLAGCYALAGATAYTSVQVAATVAASALAKEGMRLGVFARYTNAENWLMAVYAMGSHPGPASQPILTVLKRVAGTMTVLGEFKLPPVIELAASTITLSVSVSGTWSVTSGVAQLEGQDAALATGGALATGRVGIYDAWTSAAACIRTADNFSATGAEEAGRVCYSGRQLEFLSGAVQRQDSTGTYDGEPVNRGGDFYLDPASDTGAINRIAARMRRNDVEEEVDSVVTDKMKVEVLATERFLMPR